MQFVHLRLHCDFSIVDGTLQVDRAVALAAADGQGALALTDLNNMFAAVRFYQAARSRGVKPLLGCDVRVSPVSRAADAPSGRLLLLAMNHTGYLNLCELLSRAWQSNHRKGQAEIDWAWLEDGLHAGLIVLAGGEQGEIGQALLAGDEARARTLAQRAQALLGDRFYLELQRYGSPTEAAHEAQVLRLAAAFDLPVVATHPVQFAERDDFETHEARVCIAEGEILANPRRVRRFTPEQYFKTQAEMAAA
ncbi:MAG: PHP domain-containing protein, partial [Betaproteobacteria bacterium]|nr:PHP domain-containing protein [Betaproteobacteria bacterium]